MKRWFGRLPVGALAAAQPVSSIASHVGYFSCRFPTAKASNTPISVSSLRLRFQNPNNISFFASSSYGHGGVVTVPIQVVKGIRLQPKPELGLLSLVFVLSMAFAAFISLAIVSIPTMNAFRRLATSTDQLSNVVSEEVPGTLTSLKLSGLEIHQLTQQLRSLREKISPSSSSKKNSNSRSMTNPTSFGEE